MAARQSSFVLDHHGGFALRRPMLAQNTAGEAFGHTMLGHDEVDTGPAASRLRSFPRLPPSG